MMILKSKLKTIRHIARIPLAVVAIVLFSGFIAEQAAGAPPDQQKFHVEITPDPGDFYGSADSLPTKITKRASSFWFMDRVINPVTFTLGALFMNYAFPNGSLGKTCFMDGPIFPGSLQVFEEKSHSVKANFWFHGLADNAALDDILYTLRLTAAGWVGDFPPPNVFDEAVMTATAWEMTSEGKGKLRKVVCVGAGGLGTNVVVTVTRIE